MTFDPAAYYKSLADAVPIGTTPEQLEGAAKAELINQKAGFDDIANWSILNANMQSHLLAAKSAGLGAESVIPYGSQTYNVTTTVNHPAPTTTPPVATTTPVVPPAAAAAVPASSLTKTALTALASALLGVGGAGAAAGWFTPAKAPPPLTADQYEWILEVEREYSGKLSGGTGGAGSGSGSSGSEDSGSASADAGPGTSSS